MTLKHVRAGEPFQMPAATYNAFIDAAIAHRGVGGLSTDAVNGAGLSTSVFPVRNNSGVDLERFGVLTIGGPIISPTDNPNEFKSSISFTGTTPTESSFGKFAVLQEPCKAGAIAKAAFFGLCVAKVDVVSDMDGFADVKPNDSVSLRSGKYGTAQILYKESGTGVKLALIRMGINERQYYPALVSSSAAVYEKDYQWTYTVVFAECTAPGLDTWVAKSGAIGVDAYNLFENIDRATLGSIELDPSGDGTDDGTIQAIEDGALVMVTWIPTADLSAGAWYFDRPNSILAECPE